LPPLNRARCEFRSSAAARHRDLSRPRSYA
jgi:hypothetical protein